MASERDALLCSFVRSTDEEGVGLGPETSVLRADCPHPLEEDIQGWPKFPQLTTRFSQKFLNSPGS